MSEGSSESFGNGFTACLIGIAILAVAVMVGYAIGIGTTRSDCEDYGKVKLRGMWFACAVIPEKK